MSVYLFALKIVITTDVPYAPMTTHEGLIVPNIDCPEGTVLAYDADDNVYHYVGTKHAHQSKSSAWPRVQKGHIQLYRDYWRHISSGADTPYGASFRNAAHRVLREVV